MDDHKHGGKVHVKGGVWRVGERLILAFVFFSFTEKNRNISICIRKSHANGRFLLQSV